MDAFNLLHPDIELTIDASNELVNFAVDPEILTQSYTTSDGTVNLMKKGTRRCLFLDQFSEKLRLDQ